MNTTRYAYVLLAAYAAGFLLIALGGDIENAVPRFLALYSAAFLAYAMLAAFLLRGPEPPARFFWSGILAALIIAAALLIAVPTLSTDVYRYLWDGGLLLHGVNPYLIRPSDVTTPGFAGSSLYAHLGWRGQYTAYPPAAEALFAAGYALYAWLGLAVAKLWFALPYVAIAALLFRLLPRRYFLLLILNPLWLFEIWYGAHIDAWAVLLILLSWYAFEQGSRAASGALLALAALVKIYPVILMPFFALELWRRGERRALAAYLAAFSIACALLIAPLAPHAAFLAERFGAWTRDMQYNASIYALIRAALASLGANAALWAPRVAALGLLAALAALLGRRRLGLPTLTNVLLVFFLFSSVVYPWYALVFVPLTFLILAREADTSRALRLALCFILLEWLMSLTYASELWHAGEATRVLLYHAAIALEYGTFAILAFSWRRPGLAAAS